MSCVWINRQVNASMRDLEAGVVTLTGVLLRTKGFIYHN